MFFSIAHLTFEYIDNVVSPVSLGATPAGYSAVHPQMLLADISDVGRW
jgi:hypothetical protein